MNQTRFLMGIDNGGSGIKCAIFDQRGQEIAAVSISPPTSHPYPGWTERDPHVLWDINCKAVRMALSQAGIQPSQIEGVSLCGYGGGVVLTDAHGTPVYPAIVSTDTRARPQLKVLEETGAAAEIFAITHQKPWEGQAASLLQWFREEQPAVLSKSRYFLPIKDYIRTCLTGAPCIEITDASNQNLIDPATEAYSNSLFSLTCLEQERRLFDAPLLRPESIAGKITPQAARQTGLLAGTPVAAGLYDVSACTLGCGALTADAPAIINGTWSMASYLSSSYTHADLSTIVTISAVQGHYLLEQGSPTGTVNLDWFLNQFLKKIHPQLTLRQLYELCAQTVAVPNPEATALFIPFLYGDDCGEGKRGAFINVSGNLGEKELLYAVLEGILLSSRRHIKRLQQGLAPFTSAFLAGGVSASRPWSQMLCDMLQIPLTIAAGTQQGARGAAMCAGIAVGEFDNFPQAVQAISHPAYTLFPRSEHRDFFLRRTELYEKALDALSLFYAPSS